MIMEVESEITVNVCSMQWYRTPVTVKRLHQLQVEASCADLLIKENDYMLYVDHKHLLYCCLVVVIFDVFTDLIIDSLSVHSLEASYSVRR